MAGDTHDMRGSDSLTPPTSHPAAPPPHPLPRLRPQRDGPRPPRGHPLPPAALPLLLTALTLTLTSCSRAAGTPDPGRSPSPPGAAAIITPAATPTPVPPPYRLDPPGDAWYDGRSWSEQTLESLSLEEKVAQLMMPILIGGFTPSGSAAGQRVRALVEEHQVGGIIISVGSPIEVAAKLNWLQTLSDLPLLIGSDLEAGAGFRFDGVLHAPTNIWLGGATRFPALMALGASGDPGMAYEMGRVTALEARAIGVHVPFAPVLDVNNNPENPVINVRAIGEDPEQVAVLGSAFVRGVQDHGAIATAKHFPGHGDTGIDSHISLPVISVSRERMDSVELHPFRRAVNAGLGAIMTAHITVPEITGASIPATLAPAVLTDLLRDEMQFRGLVFTDAMDMGAVDRMFDRGEAAVRALEAGADVILMPPDLAAARHGIVAAVLSGRLPEERVDRSVLRILRAKENLGLNRQRTVDIARVRDVVGIDPHLAVARRVADQSITVLKDERDLLPLLGTPTANVYSVTYSRSTDLRAGRAFNSRLRQTYRRLRTASVEPDTDAAEYDRILSRARGMALTVVSLHVGVRTASGSVALPEPAVDFIRQLARQGRPHIVVAFGNPYLLTEFPEVGTYLTAWSGVPVSERAAVDAILGKIDVRGRAPTRIGDFRIGDGIQIPAKSEGGRN